MDVSVRSGTREEFIDITRDVAGAVSASGLQDGVAMVYCPHTTAGLTINENADPDVARDMLDVLQRLVPCDDGYRHCEGNADAHVKASLMGSSVMVPVSRGELQLGTWQSVYLCEFDGPRSRNVHVTTLSA
jgi:secondary thiamine-phosphate synthase enzyme